MLLSQYLLESSFCLLVFYGFYYFWLRKETFFQLNRTYLLVTPTLSLLIPFLDISLQQTASGGEFSALYPILTDADEMQFFIGKKLSEPTPAFTLSLGQLVLGFYFIGAFFMTTKLFSTLWKLANLIKNNEKKQFPEGTFIESDANFPASSFFSYIFWNSSQANENQQLILEHEKVHIRQWHSLDVLWMEILVILKWFNPLIYLFRNALRVTHEFIADAYILKEFSPVNEYATVLVNEAKKSSSGSSPNVLTHTFHSLIKQRLQKMIQPKSSTWKTVKYVLIFPIVGVMMVLFSFNCADQTTVGQQVSNLSEYIDDLGETTVLEIDRQGQNDYLQWGGVKFTTVNIFEDDGMNTVNNPISFTDFKSYFDEDLMLFLNGKLRPIKKMMVTVMQNGKIFSSCSLKYNNSEVAMSNFCFQREEGFTDNSIVLVAIKTESEHIAQSVFVVGNASPYETQGMAEYNEQLRKFAGIEQEVLTNIDLTKNIFYEEKGKVHLTWGELTINFPMTTKEDIANLPHQPVNTGRAKVLAPHFLDLENKELRFFVEGEEFRVSSFRISQLQHRYDDKFIDDPLGYGLERYKTSFSKNDLKDIKARINEGYDNLLFRFNFMSATGAEGSGSFFVRVLAPDLQEWEQLKKEGITINRPTAQFQLINRRGKNTVIKLDTTNQKYKWMCDQYCQSGDLEIVHIPNFTTITRVVTLADVIVEEDEIAASYNLINSQIDPMVFPEYHDFEEAKVVFSWRNLVGITDGKVAFLETFREWEKQNPELKVNGKKYELVQYDMTVVPADVPPIRLITNSTQTAEIQEVINTLSEKTSIYFSNILMKNEDGKVVLFPLRFAFNLI